MQTIWIEIRLRKILDLIFDQYYLTIGLKSKKTTTPQMKYIMFCRKVFDKIQLLQFRRLYNFPYFINCPKRYDARRPIRVDAICSAIKYLFADKTSHIKHYACTIFYYWFGDMLIGVKLQVQYWSLLNWQNLRLRCGSCKLIFWHYFIIYLLNLTTLYIFWSLVRRRALSPPRFMTNEMVSISI